MDSDYYTGSIFRVIVRAFWRGCYHYHLFVIRHLKTWSKKTTIRSSPNYSGHVHYMLRHYQPMQAFTSQFCNCLIRSADVVGFCHSEVSEDHWSDEDNLASITLKIVCCDVVKKLFDRYIVSFVLTMYSCVMSVWF